MEDIRHSFLFRRLTFRHTHAFDCRSGLPLHYLAYMISGAGRIVTKDETLTLRAGDLFFLPRGLCYQSFWQPDETGAVGWLSVGFALLPETSGEEPAAQRLPFDAACRDSLFAVTDGGVSCKTVGLLYSTLGALLPQMRKKQGAAAHTLPHKAAALLREDPYMPIGELAARCGVSVTGLYAAFRKRAGMTPHALRQKILVEKAVELLTTTDIPIEELSDRLGFSSSSYFRKVLYAQTGKTPTAIRKAGLNF